MPSSCHIKFRSVDITFDAFLTEGQKQQLKGLNKAFSKLARRRDIEIHASVDTSCPEEPVISFQLQLNNRVPYSKIPGAGRSDHSEASKRTARLSDKFSITVKNDNEKWLRWPTAIEVEPRWHSYHHIKHSFAEVPTLQENVREFFSTWVKAGPDYTTDFTRREVQSNLGQLAYNTIFNPYPVAGLTRNATKIKTGMPPPNSYLGN